MRIMSSHTQHTPTPPPERKQAQPERKQAIGIDIGGTKIAAGLVDANGTITHQLVRDTPGTDPRAVETAIVELVATLSDRGVEVCAVGVGAAGWMDRSGSTVVFSPHLAWRNEPLRETLEKKLGRTVLVINDADAAGWAEYTFGVGADESHLLMLTLGTGIGGSMIFSGNLVRGRYGLAGEFGHQILVPDGHVCECGNRGCWEQYASGNALGREARALAGAGSPMAAGILADVNGDISRITGQLVTQRAVAGDATCVEMIQDVGQWLGIGIANLAAALDPGTFVIGGGLSAAGSLLLDPARRTFARNLTGRGYRHRAKIEIAALGPQAGLIGAADLARRANG